jgi:hypothetical protein
VDPQDWAVFLPHFLEEIRWLFDILVPLGTGRALLFLFSSSAAARTVVKSTFFSVP